ncbi:hypothetical protein A5750_23255 [Mycobacterium sp. 852002-51613_SCH5001154]|nr:hypothetical protein A5750_23255 [Mycobacterium sp. 852002-51613_SCH5001154]
MNWFEVHRFVAPLVERSGRPIPLPGSVHWCELADHDPLKVAGCLVVSQYWAVSESARQDAMAQASQVVSNAIECGEFARQMTQRSRVYIPRTSP